MAGASDCEWAPPRESPKGDAAVVLVNSTGGSSQGALEYGWTKDDKSYYVCGMMAYNPRTGDNYASIWNPAPGDDPKSMTKEEWESAKANEAPYPALKACKQVSDDDKAPDDASGVYEDCSEIPNRTFQNPSWQAGVDRSHGTELNIEFTVEEIGS